MRHVKSTPSRLALAAIFGLATLSLAAGARATEIVIGKIEKIEIKGDLRLRQENFDFRNGAAPNGGGIDRARQRFRLRLGTELPFSPKVKVKFQLASGTGEQTSTNQSFDKLSQQKAIWIDLASLEVKPLDSMTFSAGRMKNPLWVTYSSDIVWDADLNPEGFGENFKFSLFGRGRFFLNLLQAVADEDSGTNADQWALSQQLGVAVPLFSGSRFTLSGAVHEWVHESSNTLRAQTFAANSTFDNAAPGVGQFGNRHMNGSAGKDNQASSLANEFHVVEVTAEYLTNLLDRPLSFQGTYIKNTAHLDTGQGRLFVADTILADKGSQWGLIYGKASGQGLWEVAYFHKQVAADATVADVADSDWGEGGTNRKGHIGWIAYGLTDYSILQFKAFQTKANDIAFAGRSDINRFQFDYSVKF